MFKFCIPKVTRRGAGLGNEMIPWAKAFIASRELGIKLLHPAWGLNRRKYYKYFKTSRLDWLGYFILKCVIPSYTFTRADYDETGEKDFAEAIKKYAKKMDLAGKKAYILFTEGMWGGFYSIKNTEPFLSSVLYGSAGAAANLHDIQKKLPRERISVAVHIRLGDFKKPETQDTCQGKFNISIPLSWYINTCRSLKKELQDRVTFILFSDGSPEELSGFIEEFRPITTFDQKNTVCSDLLAMANADLILCSVSSYSMIAAFLSNSPYIWYQPHLTAHGDYLSIWDCKADQIKNDGTEIFPRGTPVGDDGVVPGYLIDHLRMKERFKHPHNDLLLYGIVRKQ